MSQSRKHRGYHTQKYIAEYLRPWFPYAEPTGAGRQGSDVLGCVGIDWEIKARRATNLHELMRQLSARAVDGVLAVGVLRLDGQGPTTVADHLAILRLGDFAPLLPANGYGQQPQ